MKMLILMMVFLSMEIRTTSNCKAYDYNFRSTSALFKEDWQSLAGIHMNDSISIDETARAARDFGGMYHQRPSAIVYPASVDDIVRVVRIAGTTDHLTVAARGNGHSINGQAQAFNGIVVDMMSAMKGIHIFHGIGEEESQAYVDVYAGELWVDVLKATLREGLTPRSWTDYLFLSVGGTLSNGGVSGQAFRFGPQISNVLQLEVVTGKGEVITCSPGHQEELFYGVLGGLGQFGIIIKARIVLQRAPHMARWMRLLYSDFGDFSRDQEILISLPEDKSFDYIEGFVLANNNNSINGWNFVRLSTNSIFDSSLVSTNSSTSTVLYCLEVALYYHNATDFTALEKKIETMLEPLSFIRGLNSGIDISYFDFLNRVYGEEISARATGLWDAPHPWLNFFIPKSQIAQFDNKVLKGILRHGIGGPMLLYPLNRNKWDSRMSTAVPDEEIFYLVGLLRFVEPNPGAGPNSLEMLLAENEEILDICAAAGIEIKQYLPHYKRNGEWKRHFGGKWDQFVERKRKFDPRATLAPGLRIFSRS